MLLATNLDIVLTAEERVAWELIMTNHADRSRPQDLTVPILRLPPDIDHRQVAEVRPPRLGRGAVDLEAGKKREQPSVHFGCRAKIAREKQNLLEQNSKNPPKIWIILQ